MAGVGQQDSVAGQRRRYYSRGERNDAHATLATNPVAPVASNKFAAICGRRLQSTVHPNDSKKYCREAVTDPASQCQPRKPTRVGRAP
jgi:hypothetical protein